jgi:hypothetical protein
MICFKRCLDKIDKSLENKFVHPKRVNMTYTEHAKFSLMLSFLFLKGTLKGVVHSFCPDTLKTYSGDTLHEIDEFMGNHRNKDY